MKVSSYMTLAALIVQIKRICDPSGDVRPVLEQQAATAHHLPHLDTLLARLIAGQGEATALDEEIGRYAVRLGLLDAEGDRSVGGMWRTGEGAAMLSEEDDLALSEGLRGFVAVLEEGGVNSLTRARYDSIGGEALQRAKKLKPEARAAMERVVIGGATLADHFDRWVKVAEELSELENKRIELITASSAAPSMTSGDLLRLRREAVRRLNRLVDGVEDSGLPAAEQERILKPLAQASEEAAAGSKGR